MSEPQASASAPAPAPDVPAAGARRAGWPRHVVPTRLGRVLVFALLVAVTLAGVGVTLAGFAARQWWVAELTTHFRVQLAVGLVACGVALAAWRSVGLAGIALLAAAYNMMFLVPLFLPASGPARPDLKPLRVLLLNVQRANPEHAAVVSVIQKERPHVAVLLEVDTPWIDDLAPLSADYPDAVLVPRDDPFGVAILSRFPFMQTVTATLGARALPAVVAVPVVGDTPVAILAAHPPLPLSEADAAERNRAFLDLATLARGQGTPLVICADLNSTPWSPYFGDLLDGAGVRNASQGFGVQATWNVRWPRILAIPVDHCLVSPDVGVRGLRRGPKVGSDHLPLIVDLAISPR